MQQDKTIAVLTSGGDAPGMNAAIRAVVRAAISRGMQVLGIRHGFNGLLDKDYFKMNLRSVSDIIHRGGTVLYTARSKRFITAEGLDQAAKNCKEIGIEGIVIIGGDGSFRGAKELAKRGIQCVGLPGTIDNDIACTHYTIGFDTAMNTAMEMVDKIRDTAQSHERCSVVEVMGRRCGDIALKTGIAVGATAILVPEMPFDFKKDVIQRIINTKKLGKKNFIVIVAEGIGGVQQITEEIYAETGIEARATILGHVQRGGSPSLRDRVLATSLGCRAVEVLDTMQESRIVAVNKTDIVDYDVNEALNMTKFFNIGLYHTALRVSI